MRGSACDVILGSCAVRLPFGLPAPPAIVLRAHRESVSGLAGFSLGFRSTLPRSAGWFCTVDLNLYGYIWGTVLSQRSGTAKATEHVLYCAYVVSSLIDDRAYVVSSLIGFRIPHLTLYH